MAGLQRSVQTFRRSGSSGLVWDERFLTEGGAEEEKPGEVRAEQPRPELRHSRSVGSIGMLRCSRDEAGDDDDDNKKKVIKPKQKDRKKQGEKKGDDEQEEVPAGKKAFRTRDVAPAADPPSPRVSGCVLCAIFRGSGGGGGAARPARPKKR